MISVCLFVSELKPSTMHVGIPVQSDLYIPVESLQESPVTYRMWT